MKTKTIARQKGDLVPPILFVHIVGEIFLLTGNRRPKFINISKGNLP